MKKEKITVAISLILVCIILMAVMFAQFRTVEETDITGIKTAQETELKAMLSSWNSKYDEVMEKLEDSRNKITEYRNKLQSNEASEELLEEELAQTNMLAGKTNVVGEGVIVTLTDTEESSITVEDLLLLINELRLAGAEAISINDKRMVSNSEIVNVGDNILVNTERIVSPYIVKAIGNQTYLSSALSLKNSGYIDSTTNRGKKITMTKEKSVSILAYNGNRQMKYAKEAEE